MTNVQDMLRGADPLRFESAPREEERNRVRKSVLSASSRMPAARPGVPSRRGFVVALAAGAAGVLVVGSQIWTRDSTTLHAAVRFEMRLAENEAVPGLEEARVPNTNRVVYLHREAIATNDDIALASVMDDGNGHFSVGVTFKDAAGERVRQATAGHIGRPIAILVDGEIVMLPVLRGAVTTSATITGDYTREEAERIMNGLTVR
jgi:preprotein translocase subunit SecD